MDDMSVAAARRANLAQIIEDRFGGKTADCARAIGRLDAQLWAVLNGVRNIGERLARDIEEKLNLPTGSLDQLPGEAHGFVARSPVAVYNGVPVVGTAQLGEDGYHLPLDYPVGHGDGFVRYPSHDANAYALRVKGDSMRPRIKPGEFVLIEPNTEPKPGEEVLVRTKDGRVMVKVLDFRRDGVLQLSSINEAHRPITIEEAEVDLLHFVAAIVKAARYFRT